MNSIRKIRVNGVVQGVGFRPFVHRLALRLSLTGWVLNDSKGVLIELQGNSKALADFEYTLKNDAPALAKINSVEHLSPENSDIKYESFEIIASQDQRDTKTFIPPDSYVCNDCITEMRDPINRRYRYPFINCTNCGPRYSLIEKMPYDRQFTTMKTFDMCPACNTEYQDINDRRYHAQPNACPVCGPKVWLESTKGGTVESMDPITTAINLLKQGYVIAVKSLGGFHLAVDASNVDAVGKLRQRKKRDNKPFAVMVRDVKEAARHTEITRAEKAALEQPERPIVLLKKKTNTLPPNLAPNNPSLGVMLPCAPLHYMLLDDPTV